MPGFFIAGHNPVCWHGCGRDDRTVSCGSRVKPDAVLLTTGGAQGDSMLQNNLLFIGFVILHTKYLKSKIPR